LHFHWVFQQIQGHNIFGKKYVNTFFNVYIDILKAMLFNAGNHWSCVCTIVHSLGLIRTGFWGKLRRWPKVLDFLSAEQCHGDNALINTGLLIFDGYGLLKYKLRPESER